MKLRYLVVVCALAVPAFAAEKSPMKAGKWQITMQMEMPGMPVKMPPITTSTCVTQEQLEKDPQAALPKDKKDCKIGDYSQDGNTVNWTISCPKDNMTGKGSITFSDSKYTGTMDLKMNDQEMSVKYSGKRLGDCTE